MTTHIDYPSTCKEREREEVVKKNEHDSSNKRPVSEGVNHR